MLHLSAIWSQTGQMWLHLPFSKPALSLEKLLLKAPRVVLKSNPQHEMELSLSTQFRNKLTQWWFILFFSKLAARALMTSAACLLLEECGCVYFYLNEHKRRLKRSAGLNKTAVSLPWRFHSRLGWMHHPFTQKEKQREGGREGRFISWYSPASHKLLPSSRPLSGSSLSGS